MERELCEQDDHESLSSTDVEEQVPQQEASLQVSNALTAIPEEDMRDDGTPISWKEEPRFFLCDDWSMPMEVTRKPCPRQQPHDKLWAGVAQNFLLVALMSLNVGYGPLIERYQQATDAAGLSPPILRSVTLRRTSSRLLSARGGD